jgi:hypothetical protein
MSQYEITRAQWTAVTGWADPSNVDVLERHERPGAEVSWYDAIAFCNKLSLLEGLTPVYAVSGVDFSTLTYAQIPTSDNADLERGDGELGRQRVPAAHGDGVDVGGDGRGHGEPGGGEHDGVREGVRRGARGATLIGDYAVFGYTPTVGRTTTSGRTRWGRSWPTSWGSMISPGTCGSGRGTGTGRIPRGR